MRGQRPDTQPLEFVLSTWFLMYLHSGGQPGGLPNDFLGPAAIALIIADSVLCDVHALESEERFKGVWLSSDIFAELRKAGIIQPVDMRLFLERQGYFGVLDRNGIRSQALARMEAELSAIKSGAKKGTALRLPPDLTLLNHQMFAQAGHEFPDRMLYEWQQHHFRPVPGPRLLASKTNALASSAAPDASAGRWARLHTVMQALDLPEFRLLPTLDMEERAALQRNVRDEREKLYRWIYGDPDWPRAKYQDFRLSLPFRARDKRVDSTRRRRESEDNLRRLLDLRKETKDVRRAMRRSIFDVVDGVRTVRDVKQELDLQRQELLDLMAPNRPRLRVNIGLTGAGYLVALAGFVASAFGAPLEASLALGAAGVAAATQDISAEVFQSRGLAASRQRDPLAWFLIGTRPRPNSG